MNLTHIAESRYATKKFDANRRIEEDLFNQIKTLLRLSPSSVNAQPWHFIIGDNLEAKQRLAKGAQGAFSANESKILEASHVILFCAKTQIEDDYLQYLADNEAQDGRFPSAESQQIATKIRQFFTDIHRKTLKDTECWIQKQVYLNMGTVLLGAATLGIDAVPIEGIDTAVLNDEFELPQKGLTAVAIVALGYRHLEDFNATLPKSRLPEDKIFTYL